MGQVKNRIISFDIIRVISALLVMLYHFNFEIVAHYAGAFTFGPLNLYNQDMGDIGVTLFIILSGAALIVNNESNFSVLNFFKKRILAIYPSYWVAYLAVVIFRRLFRGGHLGGDHHYWKFILSFMGIDGFLAYRVTDFYLVGEWFTGFILIVYLGFPLLRYGLLKMPAITWLILLSIMSATVFYYQNFFVIPQKFNPMVRLPEFFFGMFFVQYIYDKKPFIYSAIVSVILIVLFILWKPPIPIAPYRLISDGAIFVVIAYAMKNFTSNKFYEWMAYLAKHSFVAFLLHHQIIYFLSGHINALKLNDVTMAIYFLGIVAFSFVWAIALDKPIRKVTGYLKNYLFKPQASQPAI
jgi:peptidoglycan/LPS O-acetylase OafA/YrhL